MNEYLKQFKRWWLSTSVLPIHALVLYMGGVSVLFPLKSDAPTLVRPLGIIILILWTFGMPWAMMMDEKNRSSRGRVKE